MDIELEIIALQDEAVPARDLGLCFSYTITEEPYHTRLATADTYEDIHKVLEEMKIDF